MFHPEEDEFCHKKKEKSAHLYSNASEIYEFLWFFVPPNVLEHDSRDRGIVLRLTLLSVKQKLNFLSERPDESLKVPIEPESIPPPRSSEGVLLNMWIFILSFSIRNRFLSFVPLHIANFLPLHFFLLYLQDNSSSHHFIVADNQNKWGKWTRFRKSVGSHEGNSNILRNRKKENDSHCVLWPLRIRISGVIWLGRLFSFPSLSRCFCFKDVKKKILSVILGAL